mmetsp:Transcript_44843/g.110029  ORF Transcript_44843/g.110029 Transcript_44843/m.110029 type:complete len:151 (-) Transcript_44843:62-514(-)|eukprot:CAMPEP_0198311500 /NCGR_PEP_ID=MMETSP1450-20131203/3197_1 /TAXON_ID=753684 ORGANISM="Madagascaria erythrocladiodes, Strain CCMP3234" /NCGR_SAMPLE_ID=MMETSP1450 /ASSEMBLY_ACC=CAM_ASM_001115 /LENGTH=150 /DNA_ID=CAMNT_0044014383 /DNA_START=43 /DNA_END=495 /DNA_ORIENTATION=+
MADVEAGESVGCCTRNRTLKEFRDFLLGGNFIRVAVALIMALALNDLVRVFVSSFVTPIIGIIGNTSFDELVFTIRGSKFTYGEFFDALIYFVMLTLIIFFCLVLPVQRLAGKCAPSWVVRKCPYCFEETSSIGTRCSHCCADIEPMKFN